MRRIGAEIEYIDEMLLRGKGSRWRCGVNHCDNVTFSGIHVHEAFLDVWHGLRA